MTAVRILDYTPVYRPAIRSILMHIGWAEQYITADEQNADAFSQNREEFGVYVAAANEGCVGFLYVEYYAWNQLAQIQSLAVEPTCQRQGIALRLVERAENFAQEKGARGIYVDTPTLNTGGRRFYEAAGHRQAYIMPRYYEDQLDGVTYQKFFVA
jgi:ribosomal protein S18 acetylase RimI-like enzyme